MICKNIWSSNVRVDCKKKRQSIDDFLMEEASFIDDNDIVLATFGYFNVGKLE
jgi:hypothetical protein